MTIKKTLFLVHLSNHNQPWKFIVLSLKAITSWLHPTKHLWEHIQHLYKTTDQNPVIVYCSSTIIHIALIQQTLPSFVKHIFYLIQWLGVLSTHIKTLTLKRMTSRFVKTDTYSLKLTANIMSYSILSTLFLG